MPSIGPCQSLHRIWCLNHDRLYLCWNEGFLAKNGPLQRQIATVDVVVGRSEKCALEAFLGDFLSEY